jgi:hypothetical protein
VAAITWDEVEAHYPGLASVDAEAQTDILALAEEALSATVFGGEDAAKYKLARIHYAAHVATLAARATGGGGAVTSKTISANSLSVSYGSVTQGDSALLATAAGTALYFLMQTTPRARLFIPRCT